MKVAIEVITPRQAEAYLAANVGNRPVLRAVVARYAREMAAGNWLLTHQGIAFDSQGKLVDGQHRLMAIIEAGRAVQMVVTRDIHVGVQIAMDDHAKRNASASLTIAAGEIITPWAVSTVRAATELCQARGPKATKIELRKQVEAFDRPLRFLEAYRPWNHKKVGSSCVCGAIAASWFYVPDLDKLGQFCEIMFGLCNVVLPHQQTALAMRDTMLRDKTSLAGGPRIASYCKTQRAIQAFQDGEQLKKIYNNGPLYTWPLVNPVRT